MQVTVFCPVQQVGDQVGDILRQRSKMSPPALGFLLRPPAWSGIPRLLHQLGNLCHAVNDLVCDFKGRLLIFHTWNLYKSKTNTIIYYNTSITSIKLRDANEHCDHRHDLI